MAIQKLHAFEKTSVQLRHTLKRLEVFADITKDEKEKKIADEILEKVKEIRKLIPKHYRDVDLDHKE